MGNTRCVTHSCHLPSTALAFTIFRTSPKVHHRFCERMALYFSGWMLCTRLKKSWVDWPWIFNSGPHLDVGGTWVGAPSSMDPPLLDSIWRSKGFLLNWICRPLLTSYFYMAIYTNDPTDDISLPIKVCCFTWIGCPTIEGGFVLGWCPLSSPLLTNFPLTLKKVVTSIR